MKKLTLILVLALFALSGFGQEIAFGNTVPVAWDPVAVDAGSVSYEVYLTPYPFTAGQEESIGRTTSTEMDITVPEGTWMVGVQSIKTAEGAEYRSEINWSHVNGEATPIPFLLRWYIAPSEPLGLRLR